jgi:cytochrome o ubiquinol oxidase operon protein cyoD
MPGITRYIIGFVLSIILTGLAYILVVNKLVTGVAIVVLLAVLALIQAIVQLIFFLHLSWRRESKWRLFAFLSMLIVLVIIVAGSLWIMYHLDYNMMHMPQDELQQRLDKEAGF